MCAYESEIMLYQLHLYARKRYPALTFQPGHLQHILDEWDIGSMRQLFDLPDEVKLALFLPLLTSASQDYNTETGLLVNKPPIAA